MPPRPDASDHEKERIERLRRAMYSRELEGKIGERPRHELDLTREVAPEDWQRHEEEAPKSVVAPRMMGIMRHALWWLLMASIVFFVGAILFFAYYFTLGGGSFSASPNNIDIAISGPPQIAGGEVTKLQIVITNRNKVSLELADLVITYPQGTRSPTDFTTDFPSQRISLGSIEPGGTRQGTVSPVFAGSSGEHESVKVELEYRLAGSNSIFVASSQYDLTLGSSPITLSIDGNSQTVSGQPVEFTVTAASNANAPIKDVLVHVDYPFGFTFTSSDPKAIADNLWSLGDLSPGDRKSLTLRGTLSGQSGDNRVFHVTAGTRANASATSITTPLAAQTFPLSISEPFLGLAVSINQKTGGDAVAAPGDAVTVNVTYQNNLATDITDAIIVARLSGLEIDGTSVHTTDGFFRSTDDTVLWDKNTTGGALSTLAPGDKGTVSFSFQMPSSDALKNITNPHLTISINAAGKRLAESGVPQNLQSAAQQTVRLATDLQMNAQALYYANPFGSSGPMPPKANSETTYALVFTITNSTNKLTDAKVTATLPSYVRWIGSYAPSTEKLTFDQQTGVFTWNIGEIAPGVGLGGSAPRQIAIAVGLTPSTSQIGQQPVLVQHVTLTGIDVATGASITRTTAPDVSTNLAQLSESSGQAIVGTDPGFSPANASVVR
jgi:hypothetical protein